VTETFLAQIYNPLRDINWLFLCLREYCSIFKDSLAQKLNHSTHNKPLNLSTPHWSSCIPYFTLAFMTM